MTAGITAEMLDGGLAEDLAAASLAMARRFARGATLWCVAPGWEPHAHHMAVEFVVHPVIVGKRALPAFALTGSDLVPRVRVAARPGDTIIAVAGEREEVVADLMRRAPAWGAACLDRIRAPARRRGGGSCAVDRRRGPHGAGHRRLRVPVPPALGADSRLLRTSGPAGTGPSEGGDGTGRLPLPVHRRRGARPAAAAGGAGRVGAGEGGGVGRAPAGDADGQRGPRRGVRRGDGGAVRFTAGGRLYAFGNGGSSTDCATFAALFAAPPADQDPALPGLNLSADQAVVTALGNDVGFDLIFSRQIIAHAGSGDIAVAFSTSGSSRDLMAALREARGRGLLTVGFAGYDGGEMAHSHMVDYCFVVRSQSAHRIQESQAILGYYLWAATQQAMHKTVDRCVHPDVYNDPSSGPNPYGGTE